jgi:cobalt-zinc-cadmium efflux system protein
MKTEKNILFAFILNLAFSVFEFVGGIFTGSVAIISDAVHDIGDAASIGISYFLEKKSKKQPDEAYTYGYARYSVMGGLITTMILLIGSALVIYNAIHRIIYPTAINYNGMIVFAVVGVIVNVCAALFTKDGHSLNQKAVNLHMLEDALGWIVVLVGAIVMRFTNWTVIDPILSIGVAIFIFITAAKNLKEIFEILLEKAPHGVDIHEIKEDLLKIEGVTDVHHVHLWSMDGHNNYATMHVVITGEAHSVKDSIREELKNHGIVHATIETEQEGEHCHEQFCHVEHTSSSGHHHHHHH